MTEAQKQKANQNKIEEDEAEQARLKREEEMRAMKKKLMAMVEEVVERQNEKDELLKFESFQVETSTRRVFGEMLNFYKERDDRNEIEINKAKDITDKCKNKVEGLEKMVKQVMNAKEETDKLRAQIVKLVSLLLYQLSLTTSL